MSELVRIQGEVEHIIYVNEDNGYTVFEFVTESELLTVTGEIPALSVGEELIIDGFFKTHKNFGEQFCAQIIERLPPTSVKAIKKYLSSGIIKGIGPAIAEKITKTFGEKSLYIIENEPEKLTQIKGISDAKATSMSNEYKMIFGLKSVVIFLSSYDILPSISVKIWKKFGIMSIDAINENPFVLCDSDVGVDFEVADKIREDNQIPYNANCRIRASISYVLNYNLSLGHTCIPRESLISITCSHIDVDDYMVDNQIEEMLLQNTLSSLEIDGCEFIFLSNIYSCEKYIAERIRNIKNYTFTDNADELILKHQKECKIEYACKQKEAIKYALNSGGLILTGGPGTGKTTTINGIISIFESLNKKVCLCAPTGRAAKRMSELCNRPAKTIHRLLEYSFNGEKFIRNEKNLLKYDVFIIDEMSMIDVVLFDALLRAIPQASSIILVGDSDQLPSVGPGNVLQDLIDSDIIKSITLDEIFRQAKESLIVTNSHLIISGELPDIEKKDNDFFVIKTEDAQVALEKVISLVSKRLPDAYDLSPINDIQVISPTKIGILGTASINASLQLLINPFNYNKNQIEINGKTFREGDKVMQIKNNYDLVYNTPSGENGFGIFNGDIGIIESIDKSSECMIINFDDRKTEYPFSNLIDLDHSYAITVHKSQGSEFDTVVLAIPSGRSKLFYRNLLYTAVTRAKKRIIIVGSVTSLETMVINDKKSKRYSALKHFSLYYE